MPGGRNACRRPAAIGWPARGRVADRSGRSECGVARPYQGGAPGPASPAPPQRPRTPTHPAISGLALPLDGGARESRDARRGVRARSREPARQMGSRRSRPRSSRYNVAMSIERLGEERKLDSPRDSNSTSQWEASVLSERPRISQPPSIYWRFWRRRFGRPKCRAVYPAGLTRAVLNRDVSDMGI